MISTTLNPKDTTLANAMAWVFYNLDSSQGYHVGFDSDDNLVFQPGGDIYLRDLPMTLQASDSPFPLSEADMTDA